MQLDEKRELYRCGKDFVTLDCIPPWSEYLGENAHTIFKKIGTVIIKVSLVNPSLVSHCHLVTVDLRLIVLSSGII